GPLSAAEQAVIRTWIAEGALNDQPVATTTTTIVSTTVTTVVAVTTTSTTDVSVPESTTTTTSSTTTTTQPATASFRGDVQPIFTSQCALVGCHSGAFPTQGLNLSEGSAYAAIVNVTSTEQATVKLVDPGSTATSYLWWKVATAPA